MHGICPFLGRRGQMYGDIENRWLPRGKWMCNKDSHLEYGPIYCVSLAMFSNCSLKCLEKGCLARRNRCIAPKILDVSIAFSISSITASRSKVFGSNSGQIAKDPTSSVGHSYLLPKIIQLRCSTISQLLGKSIVLGRVITSHQLDLANEVDSMQ